jgi:pimeloyl-ACP methyl ester carboxylesterase
MHEEALETLPELLQKLGIANPVLLGHSDGASIALIYAGTYGRVRGLILLAPHVFVEELTLASIAQAKERFNATNLGEKLRRYHKDSVATFWGWNDIWLHPEFRDWNIEEYLPPVSCPILAVQGKDDEYGTLAQLNSIQRQVSGSFEQAILDHCKHSPHRDQPDQVLSVISHFVAKLKSNP